MGGGLGGWIGSVGWLVDRANERASESGPLWKFPLPWWQRTGRTGEPNLTQWNGRMVMETAFNLHRRSLFVDWLRVGVLLTRSFPLFSAFLRARAPSARPMPAATPGALLPAAVEKSIVLYLSIRSYILFRLRDARAKRRISLWLPIAAHCHRMTGLT